MRLVIALAALLMLLAPLAHAEIEFVGILATSKTTQFALTDTATERTAWVTIGDTFSEHKLTAYDRATDTLTLTPTKTGAELRLQLKDDAKIKSARLELTGTVTLGGDEVVAIERATLLFDQENVFPLSDGVTYRITPSRRSDGNHLYRISIERAIAPNKTERVSAPSVITLPGQPFKLRIADAGFAFTPR